MMRLLAVTDQGVTGGTFVSGATTVVQAITARVYRCPKDNAIVRVIPLDQALSGEYEYVTCPNGDLVSVPKFQGAVVKKS